MFIAFKDPEKWLCILKRNEMREYILGLSSLAAFHAKTLKERKGMYSLFHPVTRNLND
jgi:hypothetical protein